MGATLTTTTQTAVARFGSLSVSETMPIAWKRGTGFFVSLILHAVLVAAVIILPLVAYDGLPRVTDRVARAFFAEPLELAPPPPPPPPPPPSAARRAATRPAPPPPVNSATLVAPVAVPDLLPAPEATLDLGLGIEGGVVGGVEGGVPGGVVGGIVGGLPPARLPPPPPRIVRVGGHIIAPKMVHRVEPEYPALAVEAHVQGIVILEARVDTRGRVTDLKVLRGHPLLDESAVAAVRRWRYRPLLLNGEPAEFILTVTLNFELRSG